MGGTTPSTIADSGATSGVGTKDDPSHRTGKPSDKRFILPSREVIQATEKAEYPFNIRAPANKLHITPSISQHSLHLMNEFLLINFRFRSKFGDTIYSLNKLTISSCSFRDALW